MLNGSIQNILRGNPVFKDIMQLVITYADRGATTRYHSRAQKSRMQARSANRKGYKSIIARWDDDEEFWKHLINSGRARQCSLDLQKARDRENNIQPRSATYREYNLGRDAMKVQGATRDHPFAAYP